MDGPRSPLTRPPISNSSLFGQSKQTNTQGPRGHIPQSSRANLLLSNQNTDEIEILNSNSNNESHRSSTDSSSTMDTESILPSKMSSSTSTKAAGSHLVASTIPFDETRSRSAPPIMDPKDDLIKDLQSDLLKLQKNVTCVICQDLLFEPFTLGCGHTFCYGCLLDWFKHKKTCPECREKVKIKPSPAYLIRDMIETFVMRAELQSPHGEGQELRQQQADALRVVERDKKSPDGLFAGMFGKTLLRAIRDDADERVLRCPLCNWEIEDRTCSNCGRRFRNSELPGHSDLSSEDDSDSDSDNDTTDSQDDESSEEDEDEDMGDMDAVLELEYESGDDDVAENFSRAFIQSLNGVDHNNFDRNNFEAVRATAFHAMQMARAAGASRDGIRHARLNRSIDPVSVSRRRPRVWEDHEESGDEDDEEGDDLEDYDEDDEEDEDEDESDMSSFIDHDTPERHHNRVRARSHHSSNTNVQPARRSRRIIVSDDEDEEDASSVSDVQLQGDRNNRRMYYTSHIRHPIVISSDNDDEEEALMDDMNGYAELEHDTAEEDDEDELISGSDYGRHRHTSSSLPLATDRRRQDSSSQNAAHVGHNRQRRRSQNVRFAVPEDADEEDYESEATRDDEGDLDMDRQSPGRTVAQSHAKGKPSMEARTRFQEDPIELDDAESSEDSMPVQRNRRRIGTTTSSNNLRGAAGIGQTGRINSHRNSSGSGSIRPNARRLDPNVRRLLRSYHQQREEQQLEGRSSASRDLAQLNSPILISSSPGTPTIRNTAPSAPDPASSLGIDLPSSTAATITNLRSEPNPIELEQANSPRNVQSRNTSSSRASSLLLSSPRTHPSPGSMRRRSNLALHEQHSSGRPRDGASTRSPGNVARSSTMPTNTASSEDRHRRATELIRQRQQVLAQRAAEASRSTTSGPTQGGSSSTVSNNRSLGRSGSSEDSRLQNVQRQHELSLQQRFATDRRASNHSERTRESATPTPATDDDRTPQPEEGIRRTDTAGSTARRRAAVNIGQGINPGPLWVVGNEDDL